MKTDRNEYGLFELEPMTEAQPAQVLTQRLPEPPVPVLFRGPDAPWDCEEM